MSVLCIDLGGTNLRASLAENSNITPDTLPRALLDGPAPGSLDEFSATVSTLVDTHQPSALGLAFPGFACRTSCKWVPNLPWLSGTDINATFPGMCVRVGNDAQLALLAEVAAGAAMNTRNAILLAIGTGIGSALLVDGRVVRGRATSFGWACADTTAPGQETTGWLENMAAGRAFDRLAGTIGRPDGPALIAAARKGAPEAAAALAPALTALGTALSGAVALTGISRIVVSGGVSEAIDILGPPIVQRMREHLPPHLRDVTLVPAAFGASASLVGAAFAANGHSCWEEDHP